MRAVACTCLMMACCLAPAGCSLFSKKTQPTQNPPPAPLAGNQPATQPATGSLVTTDQTLQRGTGILAGRVLDSYDHNPPPTFIQVVCAQEANGSKGAPIEIATDEQGYFTIHGLQPGQHYELIARTKDGAAKLAGRAWATPPNARLLIRMLDEFATQNVPPAPGAPAIPGQKPSPTNALPGQGDQDSANGDRSGQRDGDQSADQPGPARLKGPNRNVDILPPVRLGETPSGTGSGPPTTTQPRAEIRPQDIVGGPRTYAQGSRPANIPSPLGAPVPALQVQPAPSAATVPMLATQVPSCVLTGRQLDNFALYDLNGKPWEYRNHTGRLVLLDFWGTWCTYCLPGIPHLRILQERYGTSGLEVIGIAYERGGTFQEQSRAVQSVRDRQKVNYRLLLGGNAESCPVRTQFGVDGFPTLVLLDSSNRIIWKEKGLLDQVKLHDLQIMIESQLRQAP